MSSPLIRYADLVFQPDLRAATRDDGTTLSLTRQERALILQLTRRPQQLVTRQQLLDGLGDLAGDLNERNIDYLVNRLRKRLGDHARAPRFIATQYGEGYLWIADPMAVEPVSAFLVVGPVYGLGENADAAAVVDRLSAQIGQALRGSRTVLCLPHWRFAPEAASQVAHSLEISLLAEDGRLHLALVLKDGRTNTPIRPFRLTLPLAPDTAELAAFAQSLVDALWAYAALPDGAPPNPTDRPLLLRLHDAAVLVTGDIESWRHNAQRLRAAHADNPGDPALAVLLALNRYTELIQGPLSPDATPLTDAQWRDVEDDIEQLAPGALAKADGEPMLLLGIAKVLCFLDRGYLKLAAQLTDAAFQASTAFAAAFSMKGLTLACQGDIDRAVELYSRAIELSEPGSQFHIYLLILKGSALLAADRRGEVAQMVAELSALDPASRGWIGLIFLSPKARHTPPALAMIPKEAGRRMLTYLHRTTARQFERRHHRKNVLHGLALHLARAHGEDVIPPAVKEYFPKRFTDAS
ncbi:winged helix-turn-helix domain-containing protein [Castellaniella hirudinis]|uniref:Winged helix-turn-helix domain-containing protein n=1 Tax=Castellaniella hirudinis TaxID=1144617 RepID=A0ABV8S395_9BURK